MTSFIAFTIGLHQLLDKKTKCVFSNIGIGTYNTAKLCFQLVQWFYSYAFSDNTRGINENNILLLSGLVKKTKEEEKTTRGVKCRRTQDEEENKTGFRFRY